MAKDKSFSKQFGFSGKDWVALSFSALALTISAGSAYFSIVWQTDNVSLVFQSPPIISMFSENLYIEKPVGYPMVLINSGNRAVAISWITFLVFQHKKQLAEQCQGDEGEIATAFQTDFEPMVLKEKEVAIKTLRVTRAEIEKSAIEETDINGEAFLRFPVKKELKGSDYLPVEVCLEVSVSTPSLAYHSTKIQVGTLGVTSGGVYLDDKATPPGWVPRPQVVIKRSGTIFDE
jgi:hypothetical protein